MYDPIEAMMDAIGLVLGFGTVGFMFLSMMAIFFTFVY